MPPFPLIPQKDHLVISDPGAPKDLRTKGGIYIPDVVIPKYQDTGVSKVLAIGPEVKATSVGDTVVFPGQHTRVIRFMGVEYWSIREADILAKVSPKVKYEHPEVVDLKSNKGPRDISDMDRQTGEL